MRGNAERTWGIEKRGLMASLFAAVCIIIVAPFYLLTHPAELLLAISFVAVPVAIWKLGKKFEEWLGLK